MSTIECVWRVHTEALLTCLRVIDNWQDVFTTILTSIKKEGVACLTWLSVKILWTWHVLKLHENLKSKFFWFFTPTFTTILTSIKKEGVACLTWLSVRILWTWHVLKLHENLIISSSELNDKWEILIFTVVLDKIHSCASQDWHPLRHIDFTATLDLDRHRNDIS